jgi:hypothetical protein
LDLKGARRSRDARRKAKAGMKVLDYPTTAQSPTTWSLLELLLLDLKDAEGEIQEEKQR